MYEVQFHHRPHMHDESFDCATEDEVVAVLKEGGVPEPDCGSHFNLPGGGFAVVLERNDDGD